MSTEQKQDESKFALIAERLLYGETDMDYDTFRESARRLGPRPSPFGRLVVSAYVECRDAEGRVQEMADQVERTLKGFRASIDMLNNPNAESICSAMNQLGAAATFLEAKVESLKLIINMYVQQRADLEGNK